MMSDIEIIKEEIDSILEDIRDLYESSGKKVSGSFGEGLEAVYTHNSGTIRGFVYLAGRKAGKMPPVKNILAWVKARGLKSFRRNKSASSIAWAIAKKIKKEGTNRESAMKIYEQVITPQRIDSIIERVSRLNVNRIITELTAEIKILAKNV